ncbi:hypothetical protein L21_0059 [Methanoculleus chikugoensis]|uniref:Uncharacterized protein n=1 Tax=Methanoculleus chikugoensis TaxID=118126 RepID=A0A1M4MH15_9EURY|nr:hypothetical protein L21_0059 [Methanoculleus chikugoensis]
MIETGEGETPLPVGPTPSGDIPTVHCMGRSRKIIGFQLSPGARLSTGYRHALPPPLGAGEEAEGRAGWG